MKLIVEQIGELISRYPGRLGGAIVGFVTGILLLTLGIKKTLFIILITLLGFLVGFLIDSNLKIPGLPSFRKRSSLKKSDETDVYYENSMEDDESELK